MKKNKNLQFKSSFLEPTIHLLIQYCVFAISKVFQFTLANVKFLFLCHCMRKL